MPSRNRGKKKQKLRDLSRKSPTSTESMALMDALPAASPIACAFIGAVMVEHELDTLLRRRIPDKSDEMWDELTSDNGPLGTLHRKIVLAHALKICNEATKDILHVVRNVRNAFAHAKTLIDFEHELVVQELTKANIITKRYRNAFETADKLNRHQELYSMICRTLSIYLLRKRVKGNRISATKKNKPNTRGQALSSYAAALAPFLQHPPTGLRGLLTSANPAPPIVDPIPASPPSISSKLNPKTSKPDDSTGK